MASTTRNFSFSRPALLGMAFAVLAAIGFSAKAILIKLAYLDQVDAVTMLALRMAFALPFFLAAIFWSGQGEPLARRDWLSILALGLLGYYLSSMLDFMGLLYISAGLERLILFLYPTMVVIFSALLFGQPISRREIIALLLSYVGISVVFLHDISVNQSAMLLGAGLVFASTLSYSLYLVGAGQAIARIGTMRFTAYAMTVSCIASLLQFVLSHPLATLHLPLRVYELGLAMAIFSTVLPAFMLSASIRRIGSGHASLIGAIGPISTLYLAHVFLNESLSWQQIGGSMLVLAGVLAISLGGGQSRKP